MGLSIGSSLLLPHQDLRSYYLGITKGRCFRDIVESASYGIFFIQSFMMIGSDDIKVITATI
jgi:hypothetical protein